VARAISAAIRGESPPAGYDGAGACYLEFGNGEVGRVDVNFFGGPKPTGSLTVPSAELVAEKARFGSSRIERWFGPPPGH
jgi:sulfide:quinone oxidoreductase